MYISLYDLGGLVLFFLFGGVCIYLIAVLRRAFCVLGVVRGLLNDHEADIRETVSLLPETLTNINDLAVSLREATDSTNNAMIALQTDLTDTVDDLRDGLETFTLYARIIGDVVRSIFSKSA